MTKTGASVTEWSKVLRSGRSVFARVGSSPTACIFVRTRGFESHRLHFYYFVFDFNVFRRLYFSKSRVLLKRWKLLNRLEIGNRNGQNRSKRDRVVQGATFRS